eukprot:199077-Pleurochrysis_carterae.AAC.1
MLCGEEQALSTLRASAKGSSDPLFIGRKRTRGHILLGARWSARRFKVHASMRLAASEADA